jgi:hypothetical protein
MARRVETHNRKKLKEKNRQQFKELFSNVIVSHAPS